MENYEEIEKLVEYAELSGFSLYPKDDRLIVKNGKHLPEQLGRLIKLYKPEIMDYLNTESEGKQ